jgi:hypothetical protein
MIQVASAMYLPPALALLMVEEGGYVTPAKTQHMLWCAAKHLGFLEACAPLLQFTQKMATKISVVDNARVQEGATAAVRSDGAFIAALNSFANHFLPPSPGLPPNDPPITTGASGGGC